MRQHQKKHFKRRVRDDAVVNPTAAVDSLQLGPLAVMSSTQGDLDLLCDMMNLGPDRSQPVFMSRIYTAVIGATQVSLAGPFVGAPYAAMILEALIAGGVRKVIFFGWCGAISPKVGIGDVIVPTSAIIDEGTSKHYFGNQNFAARPSLLLVKRIIAALKQQGLSYHEGQVWSTDAVFRETKDQVREYQSQKVLAVEMEASALFTVAEFRRVEVGGVLVVSDELSSLQWRPGFKHKSFKQKRMAVCEVIKNLCLQA